jgi:hypothetical protein
MHVFDKAKKEAPLALNKEISTKMSIFDFFHDIPVVK